MKQILLTCDTEVGELAQGFDEAFDIFVLGKITGEQVGVPLINSIAEEHGAVVNHFVDVYHPCYEKNFIALCEQILSDGHFVGLHTHPGSRFGRMRAHVLHCRQQDSHRIVPFSIGRGSAGWIILLSTRQHV